MHVGQWVEQHPEQHGGSEWSPTGDSMSSDPHPPGNCIQTAVSKHPSEGPSLQKGPEKTQGGSWARCQPTETTPFLCVLFFFSFFHAFKSHDKGARFAPYQKKTEQRLLGGMGGRSSPPALHHKLGTCFGHTRLWSSLQRAAVEQQGWVLLQSFPPLWDPTHCHHAKLGNPTRNPHRRSRIHSPATLVMAVGRLPSSDALLLLLLLFRTAVLRPRCKNINQLQQPTGPSTASPALDELLLLFCRSAAQRQSREEWRNAKRNGILTFLLRLAPGSTAGGAHSQQGSPAAREQTELFNICPSRPSSQQLHWKSWV